MTTCIALVAGETSVTTRDGNVTTAAADDVYPSFSLVANDVIEQVDDDVPVHMINISRVCRRCMSLIYIDLHVKVGLITLSTNTFYFSTCSYPVVVSSLRSFVF